jgi:hypothetical protein
MIAARQTLKGLACASGPAWDSGSILSRMESNSPSRLSNLRETIHKVGGFGRGMWRYWRLGEPAPESNFVVQKLYAYTDGRSNDFLFRLLESKRKERDPRFSWDGSSLISEQGSSDPGIAELVRTLKRDGVAVLTPRLSKEAIASLHDLATSCQLNTRTYCAPAASNAPETQTTMPKVEKSTSNGLDPTQPRHSVYEVPRSLLLENQYLQSLLCDPYLLSVAAGYLGVFPVVTKPDMWWDTDCVPAGLRPRPFHVDSGCLRWLKVGINLTETTLETPHFVYVKGSHNPNRMTRRLTRRLASRMNLSDNEVTEICPERIVHFTAPAGSITLADTRGIHKGELASRGQRLILYFGLEGSAFNNIDQPLPLNKVGAALGKAMNDRPFSYQFFRKSA